MFLPTLKVATAFFFLIEKKIKARPTISFCTMEKGLPQPPYGHWAHVEYSLRALHNSQQVQAIFTAEHLSRLTEQAERREASLPPP